MGVRDGDSKLAGHIDVAQMLLREPRLLTAGVHQVTRRLFELRVKMPGQLDVARLLMQQPSLLLTEFEELECASKAGDVLLLVLIGATTPSKQQTAEGAVWPDHGEGKACASPAIF